MSVFIDGTAVVEVPAAAPDVLALAAAVVVLAAEDAGEPFVT
jgi:hypothetical protein